MASCGPNESSSPLDRSVQSSRSEAQIGSVSVTSTASFSEATPFPKASGNVGSPGPSPISDVRGSVGSIPKTEGPVDDKLRELVLKCHQIAFLTGKWGCFGDLIEKSSSGQVLQAVKDLIGSSDIDSSVDTHNLSHIIGRQTARVLGLNGEAFLSCSIDFNYGCQHGFFEHALANSPNATEAATAICANLIEDYSEKTVFYCYHGVGHGVMMASAYDLSLALDICDALGDVLASDGCWQGVFMENTNAVMRGEAREGIYSDIDPLAPCNSVADRHKWECYLNHAGRLITFFNLSVSDASHACLDASPNYILPCIQSLGLMVSNSVWQLPLVGPRSRDNNVEVTLELCGHFPVDYLRDCIIGAVDNIMNFDGLILDRAMKLCSASDESYRDVCFYRIGLSIRMQLKDIQQMYFLCQQVDQSYRETCLNGAGVEVVEGRVEIQQVTAVQEELIPSVPSDSSQGTLTVSNNEDCPVANNLDGEIVEVWFVNGAVQPDSLTVASGETVRWINGSLNFVWPASDVHPTHQIYRCFDARKPIPPGESWDFTFNHSGLWGYHDHMNPRTKGNVIVVDDSSGE